MKAELPEDILWVNLFESPREICSYPIAFTKDLESFELFNPRTSFGTGNCFI